MRALAASAAAVACLAIPTAALATHAEPLRAMYHLDAYSSLSGNSYTTDDSSGHGLTGAGTDGGATYIIDDGRFGKAFHFGADLGTDEDGVAIARSALLEPQTITAVAWVRASDPPGQYAYVMSKGGGGCGASSYALSTFDTDDLTFYVLHGSTPVLSPRAPAAQVWDGNWHMVAGTFDGSRVRLYVDGTQVGTGTPAPAGIHYGLADNRLFLGTYAKSDSCVDNLAFQGDIDEARVYSRALTPTEIGTLAAAPGPDPPPTLAGGGAGGSAPVATFKSGKSHKLKRAIWLSGKDSKPSKGKKIVKYEWDFNADGVYDASCGGSLPAVSHPFRKGTHTVRLRVTDSAGKHDLFTHAVGVSKANQNLRSASVFACEDPLGGNQPDTPSCIKTFSFGDIVEVNSRGDPDQCFKIEPRRELPTVQLPGAAARKDVGDVAHSLDRYTVYHAKLRGALALNGIPIPVPHDSQTEYDSWKATVGIGTLPIHISLPGKLIITRDIRLEFEVSPQKGRFQLPSAKTGKLSLFGLKLGGGVEVALLRHRKSEIRISLILPSVFKAGFNKEAEGDFTLHASNAGGVEFEGARIQHIPHVFIGPLLVNDLFFEYKRTGNIWRGGANFQLAAVSPVQLKAAPPPPDYGFGLRDGKFDYAGGGVAFPIPPRPQLFPGVGLVEIGGAIGLNPTRFTGRIAIDVGSVFAIDGSAFVALATKEHPYDFPDQYAPPGLEFLAGRTLDSTSIAAGGVAKILVPVVGEVPLVNAYIFYAYPDYAEFGGGFKFGVGDEDNNVRIEGGITGWVQLLQKKFNLEGKVQGCIDIDVVGSICKGVDAVVSSAGIGFCTVVPVPMSPFGPTVPVDAGIGYRWGDSFPDLMLFSCDVGPYREVKSALRTAATGPRKFTLPGGLPSAMVRVKGVGAAPKLILTKPGGKKVSIPQTGKGKVDTNVIGVTRDSQKVTLIGLRKPRGGTWSVAPQAGSSIASVAVANGLRKPQIKASVSGHGRKRTLHYDIGAAPGQRVTFFERGARTFHRLGVANGAHGKIRFRPADGRKGERKIMALVERGGVTRESLVVARYTAPGPARPGKPRGLRVKRTKKKGLVVSWRSVGGAARYAVLAQQSNGFRYLVTTRKTRAVFARFNPFSKGKVFVRALGRNGIDGRVATAKVKARKPRHP